MFRLFPHMSTPATGIGTEGDLRWYVKNGLRVRVVYFSQWSDPYRRQMYLGIHKGGGAAWRYPLRPGPLQPTHAPPGARWRLAIACCPLLCSCWATPENRYFPAGNDRGNVSNGWECSPIVMCMPTESHWNAIPAVPPCHKSIHDAVVKIN